MKILVLSSDSEIASTKRLLEALKKSHPETEVLNPNQIHFEFGAKGTSFFHSGKKLARYDLVLPRLGWGSMEYGLHLARAFESAGIQVINSAESLTKATHKLLCLQIFQTHRLPIPQTRFSALTLETKNQLFQKTRKAVFKTLQGSQGFGVTWALNSAQAQAQVDAYRTAKAPFLIQELIEESSGEDIRAFVIDGEIVAAMKRTANQDELRSNLHQGGKAQSAKLSQQEQKLVLAATKSLGLTYAGVDFLRSKKGPLLLEANPFPGFDGISKACKMNVAGLLTEKLFTK